MGLKEAYQEKIEAQIREWNAKLDEYKAKADKAKADVKIQMYQQMDRLRAQKEAEGQGTSFSLLPACPSITPSWWVGPMALGGSTGSPRPAHPGF